MDACERRIKKGLVTSPIFVRCQHLMARKIAELFGRGDTVQILARWCCPVASRVAMDLLHRAMHTSPHRRIAMAIKMASKGHVFFDIVDLSLLTTIAKGTCYGP